MEELPQRTWGLGQALVMWAARRYCGMTWPEVALRMDGKDYAAVSMALKRFDKKLATDAGLRRRLARLEKPLNVET